VSGAECLPRANPVLADGRVFLYTRNRDLLALDAADGSRLWRRKGLGGEPGSSPRVTGDVVLCGRMRVHGVVADSGEDAWSPGPLYCMFPRYSAERAKRVYVTTRQFMDTGKLWALDTITGRLRSLMSTGRILDTTPVTGHGLVYVASGNGSVLAVDPQDGAVRWEAQMGSRLRWTPDYRPSPPCLAGDRIWAAGPDRKIHAWNAHDGADHWAFGDNVKVWSSPVPAGEVVAVMATDGSVYALTEGSPPSRWVLRAGEPEKGAAMAAPTVACGVLYVGSPDRYLYAFEIARIPPGADIRYSKGRSQRMGNQYTFNGPVTGSHFGDGDVHNYRTDPQLSVLVRELLRVIADHQCEEGPAAPASEEAQALRAEIEKAAPDRGRISRLVAAIAGAAPGVTAVADAAYEVLRLLGVR
jgi:outer membrane protein assembly factor BamB